MLKRTFQVWLLGFLLAGPAAAASVRPLQLDEIIDSAAIAFQGVCLENRTVREEKTNLVVTYTTFAVKDVLKGSVGTVHTIKQIGGDIPAEGPTIHMDGVPNFVVGENYIVFLAGTSAAGFSSPVGLAQGKFTVRKDSSGQRVSNGRDFREMTAGIASKDLPVAVTKSFREAPDRGRHLDLAEFKQLVRTRARRTE